MFDQTNEIKVLRDPIHGYIHISYQVIWKLLNSSEFQRLRRIHQLGGDYMVYHTAEHSRFSHSLGVYEIVRRMIDEVESIATNVTQFEKIQVMCAALLHDIGHGPFSHMFEHLHNRTHEEMTVRIILDENTQVHQILRDCHPELPEKVVSIIQHEHEKEFLNQMISSQLDADRMDYLLRDAYETGTSYGNFDLERILRTLRVHDGYLCMKESGMHSVEDYIMARYHMYWQVYLHPDAKAYEILILKFIERYKSVHKTCTIPVFEPFCEKEFSLQQYLLLDDNRVMYGFQEAQFSKDEILSDLAYRILNRRLLDWIENPSEEEEIAIKRSSKNAEYYYYEEHSLNKQVMPYQELSESQTIWILSACGQIHPLSKCSEIVKALLKMENVTKKRIYFQKND
ncbi:MAG: HD domain-containing protein [Firmicutes bacterium]|nr:HD domain-containing protein [Bacillota bacterium]